MKSFRVTILEVEALYVLSVFCSHELLDLQFVARKMDSDIRRSFSKLMLLCIPRNSYLLGSQSTTSATSPDLHVYWL